MVTCLGRGADLEMAQQLPLPLTVSCFSKIQIGILVPAQPGNPEQSSEGRETGVCMVCVLVAVTRIEVLLGVYFVNNARSNYASCCYCRYYVVNGQL